MGVDRESELYLAEIMLRNFPEEVIAGLLVQAAIALQGAGLLSDTEARRTSKLVGDVIKSEARAA